MDIIEMTRELGKAIQKDDRYLNLHLAAQNCEDDQQLQELIGDFNLKRLAINKESAGENGDEAKIAKLNEEMRHAYARILQNPNMAAYNAAREELDGLMQRVTAIITKSVEGEDPETADYEASCSGSCATCGGCH